MTEPSGDPWKSLADELGLEPGEASPPPQPPKTSAPPPPTSIRAAHPEHPSSPPKKTAADWNALAGNLGLEPASDFETGSRDPVAELFGFSPSMPVEPESRESMRPDGEMSDDEFGETRERYATDDREESDFRGEAPTRSPEDRSDRPRPRRRRGGRGRGRDRGDDRGGYDRQPRPASIERSDDDRRDVDRPRIEGDVDNDLEPETHGEEPEEPLRERPEREPGGEDRFPKRRRRGRRGRGRSRDRDEIRREPAARSAGDEQPPSPDASLMDEPMEIEFVPIDENGMELVHDHRPESSGDHAHADSDNDLDDDNGLHDEPHGKSSVRDIVTWKEAIGMMIEANIQNHARSPQGGQSPSHHGYHGQRDSRGRGRGRGGRGGRR
jgi:hypothetical protein